MFAIFLTVLLLATVQGRPDPNEDDNKLVEGDMILTEAQKDALYGTTEGQNRNGKKDDWYHWPKGEVRYEMPSSLSWRKKQFIRKSLRNLQTKLDSCIKFVESTSGNRIRVTGNSNSGCSSAVGYQHRETQDLNLANGCYHESVVQHEFLHAIGLHHHQNRHDRDEYVNILWDNIEPDMKHNFNKYSANTVTHFGLPYDYNSVMHYSSYAFSKNRRMTIQTKDSSKQNIIGKAPGISNGDVQLVKKLYKCEGGTGSGNCDYTDNAEVAEHCPYWAKQGYCSHSYQDWMDENCQKTCKC